MCSIWLRHNAMVDSEVDKFSPTCAQLDLRFNSSFDTWQVGISYAIDKKKNKTKH